MSSERGTVTACQFNQEVNCKLPRACKECGWNPKVAEARLKKIVYGEEVQELKIE